jgi:hypothetical protein
MINIMATKLDGKRKFWKPMVKMLSAHGLGSQQIFWDMT